MEIASSNRANMDGKCESGKLLLYLAEGTCNASAPGRAPNPRVEENYRARTSTLVRQIEFCGNYPAA